MASMKRTILRSIKRNRKDGKLFDFMKKGNRRQRRKKTKKDN